MLTAFNAVPDRKSGHVLQLRAHRPGTHTLPGAHARGLHPRVPALGRAQHRVRPTRFPDGGVHQRAHRGVHKPKPDDMAGRLWPAVAEEQLPRPVLSLRTLPLDDFYSLINPSFAANTPARFHAVIRIKHASPALRVTNTTFTILRCTRFCNILFDGQFHCSRVK